MHSRIIQYKFKTLSFQQPIKKKNQHNTSLAKKYPQETSLEEQRVKYEWAI